MFEFSESEENEFKSSFNNDTVTREIVAFLNAHGGRIFIGVNNDKTICGVRSVDETQRKISDIITNQIEPYQDSNPDQRRQGNRGDHRHAWLPCPLLHQEIRLFSRGLSCQDRLDYQRDAGDGN